MQSPIKGVLREIAYDQIVKGTCDLSLMRQNDYSVYDDPTGETTMFHRSVIAGISCAMFIVILLMHDVFKQIVASAN